MPQLGIRIQLLDVHGYPLNVEIRTSITFSIPCDYYAADYALSFSLYYRRISMLLLLVMEMLF